MRLPGVGGEEHIVGSDEVPVVRAEYGSKPASPGGRFVCWVVEWHEWIVGDSASAPKVSVDKRGPRTNR